MNISSQPASSKGAAAGPPLTAAGTKDAEKILLVEDAPDSQLMVKAVLEPHYRLTVAGTLREAREELARQEFRLVILDVNLPDGDGFRFCTELREHGGASRRAAVIFLTGRSDLEDKLKGFSLGADDYVVKPFERLELRARVEARLSRLRYHDSRSTGPESLTRGSLHLDLPALRAFVTSGATGRKADIGLTPIEFKILYHLARNEGAVVSREQLIATVWGESTHVFDRATDKHVSSLRQKLGECATCIETVSRVGYRFMLR